MRCKHVIRAVVFSILVIVPTGYLRADVSWVFDLSGKGRFFDLPYPTELRRDATGAINIDDYPNRLGLKAVERSKQAIKDGYGYSTGPVVYFRFTGAINTDNLPGLKESLRDDSPIFLVDIDPDSPEFGRRFPLESRFYKKAPKLMSPARNLLAITPVHGFVLREDTLYAAGVLSRLGDRSKNPLQPGSAIREISSGRAPEGALGDRALEVYSPALDSLSRLGFQFDEFAALTVFRTGSPFQRMLKLFEGIKDRPVLEVETGFQKTRAYDLYTVLEGAVMMPQFQTGTPPYGHGKGGRILFDKDEKPFVQRMERVPVCFTVPKGKMPESGFPIMIYIHGTMGISTQVVDRGEVREDSPEGESSFLSRLIFGSHGVAPEGTGPAMVLAQHGIAAVGAAQPQNEERGGQPEMIYFYNVLSPEAMRDNILQAAAEASMLLRFVQRVKIKPELCPGTETAGGPVRFDPELIFGMGQSLGSLILAPFGAVETDVVALIPSGNGAYFRLSVADSNPLGIGALEKSHKGFTKSIGIDRYHPIINLLVDVIAPADPFVFQPHYFREPLPGREPKHVWESFGLYDHYFYPVAQNAAIMCLGMDFAGPVREASTEEMLELAGLEKLAYPVRLNKGEVTAVAIQYEQWGPMDGHHINFQRPDTKYQYGCFLESLVKEGSPTLYAPKQDWDAVCGE